MSAPSHGNRPEEIVLSAYEPFESHPPGEVASYASSETDYAAALSKVPGFAGYTARNSESLNHGNTSESSRNVDGLDVIDETGVLSSLHSNDHVALEQDAPTGEGRLSAVSQLKHISRKRNLLLQIDTRTRAAERKLTSIRKDFKHEIARANATVDDNALFGIDDLTRRWRRRQLALQRLLREMDIAEGELSSLQQQRIRILWQVKSLEDDLYTSMAEGTRPDDSVASQEDRLLTARVLGSATQGLPDHAAFEQYPSLRSSPKSGILQNARGSGVRSEPNILARKENNSEKSLRHDSTSAVSSKRLRGRRDSANRAGLSSSLKLYASDVSTDGPQSLFDLLTRGCGALFPPQHLQSHIEAASQDHILAATRKLNRVRRIDFRSVLGYDLGKLSPDLSSLKASQEIEYLSGPQRLASIRAETIHTGQYIYIWGLQMSQNAALETWRTYSRGRLDAGILAKYRKGDPLLQLIEEVRRLKVLVGSTEIFDLTTDAGDIPDIDVTSSIDVQPSVDTSHNASSGQPSSIVSPTRAASDSWIFTM
ncbi:hypothetical protein LTS08_008704 [Lithohypha guttulata]|nr:hypothetical protein LTS08_008704 [Lithohypha guttulata]